MSERLSTLGMSLQYAVETVAGERPTTGYLTVPEVKSIPSFNVAPETIESTTLAETEFKTYVPGLKDLGGALEFTANLTADLITFWEQLMAAYETAAADGKAVWFVIVHPKLPEATYFTGQPSSIGMNEVAVNSMYETTLFITPSNEPAMYDAPATV